MLDSVFFLVCGLRVSNGPEDAIFLDAVYGCYSDPLQLFVGE